MPERQPDTRDEILRQAARLFATRGFGGTTVRHIADAARLLSGSLYHHFPSKEAILLELLEEFFHNTLDRYRRTATGDADPVERLRAMVRISLEIVVERPELARVVVGESQRLARSPRLGWLGTHTSQLAGLWNDVVEQGVRRGQLRADLDASAFALMLQAAVWGMSRWFRSDGVYDPEEAAGRFVSLFVDGAARPGRRPSRPVPALLGPRWGGGTRFLDPVQAGDPDVGAKAVMAGLPPGTDARTRIRTAAGLLFARHGYVATTVRRIADLAEVPVGSLAHHIGSKEHLIVEMLGAYLADLREAFAADDIATGAPLRRLEALITRTVEGYDGRGVASVLILNELPREVMRDERVRVGHTWISVIEAGKATGELREDLDPAFTQRVIRSAIAGAGATFRAVGTADVAGLHHELMLTGAAAGP